MYINICIYIYIYISIIKPFVKLQWCRHQLSDSPASMRTPPKKGEQSWSVRADWMGSVVDISAMTTSLFLGISPKNRPTYISGQWMIGIYPDIWLVQAISNDLYLGFLSSNESGVSQAAVELLTHGNTRVVVDTIFNVFIGWYNVDMPSISMFKAGLNPTMGISIQSIY